MADVQLENGYIRIATELMDEVIRRDFSKRQLAILHFIIRLSYGCQKKDCIIEKFNLFEIAGINKVDIKKELKFLRECGVINWDETSMLFSINKDYEKWQISPSKGFDKEKLDQLIHQNLNKKVSKTLTGSESEVSKTRTKTNKKVSETLTDKLVKHELEGAETPCGSKVEEVSKDSIKDISLKINTTTTNEHDVIDIIADRFIDLRTMSGGRIVHPNTKDYEAIARIVASGMPLPQTIKLLEQCFGEYNKRNPNGSIKAFSYCEKYIVDHYEAIEAREEAKKLAKRRIPDHGKVNQRNTRGTQKKEPAKDDSITGGQVGWLGRKKVSVSEVPGQNGDYL